MERIKDLSKIIIQDEAVLMEIIELVSKGGLIKPGAKGPEADYCIVRVIGTRVNKVKVGDIVLRFIPNNGTAYDYKDKPYIMIHQASILMAVESDNFESKLSNLILN